MRRRVVPGAAAGASASAGRKATSDRAVLAARVTVILRALGHDSADAVVGPEDIARIYAGHWQRKEGSWSWGTMTRFSLGSQWPMRACARAVLVVTQRVDQYSLDPASKFEEAPPGASFGIATRRDVKWYDAEGRSLPVPPQER